MDPGTILRYAMGILVLALFLCVPGVLWESARSRFWLRRDAAQLVLKEGLGEDEVVSRLLPRREPKLVRIARDAVREAQMIAVKTPAGEIAKACKLPISQVELDLLAWNDEPDASPSPEQRRRWKREVIVGTLTLWSALLLGGWLSVFLFSWLNELVGRQ